MIHLVSGGSGSGKSEYGESLILGFGEGQRFYIATMEPSGSEEGKRRIARHRRLRRGKGFVTVEWPRNLGELVLPGKGKKNVLLECVSNLAANEMFYDGARSQSPELLAGKIAVDIRTLSRQADNLVIVTNQIGEDGCRYDALTRSYIALVGQINQELAVWADRVTEVVYGIPVTHKEEI